MKVADGGGAHAEAEHRALGNGLLTGLVRHALLALGLVEEVRELGPRAFESRCVEVGDVLAMTSRFICWAFMPVAAMARALTASIP